MFISQISVFMENTNGSLSRLTRVVGKAGVDLIALAVADTEHFGIARCIAADTDKAAAALREAGYSVKLTDVLAVCVPDRSGALSKVLSLLENAGIAVEYLYSFLHRTHDAAVIIFRVSENAKAVEVLSQSGIRLLSQEEVSAL